MFKAGTQQIGHGGGSKESGATVPRRKRHRSAWTKSRTKTSLSESYAFTSPPAGLAEQIATGHVITHL